MKKRIFLVLLLVLGLYFPSSILAETILLKSGKTVEGKLIEKTDKYIKIDFQGTSLTYFFDEIESIDGQKQPLTLEKKEPISEPNVNQVSENSVQSDITQETKNQKTDAVSATKLPFSTAIIKYVWRGWAEGESSIFLDVKHNRAAQEHNTTRGNKRITMNTMNIYDGKFFYTFSPGKKTGVMTERKEGILGIFFDEAVYSNLSAKQENFLGKECNVYETKGSGKLYFWNGIMLKQEILAQGNLSGSTIEATSIQLDVPIPSDKFDIPKEIEFKEIKFSDVFAPSGNAEEYFYRGNTYGWQHNFTRAILEFSKAIAINPNYVDAYINRGVAYGQQGNFSQAISDYNKAIEINPNDAMPYNNRGRAYAKQGNFSQAISDCTKAIEIKPINVEAYYNRGNVYAKQGNLSQAISDFTKANAINPNFADVYPKEVKLLQAISNYTKAIEINPNDAGAYYNRGLAYGEQGSLTQAISDFKKVIAINPNYADVYGKQGNLPQKVSGK